MIRRQFFMTFISGIAFFAAGCYGRGDGKPVLAPESFEGRIMFTDQYSIEIENKSAHDLDDVKLSLTLFDGEGNRQPLKQHWANWNKGETKKVRALDANGEPFKVLNGAAGEGSSSEYSFRFTVSLGDEF